MNDIPGWVLISDLDNSELSEKSLRALVKDTSDDTTRIESAEGDAVPDRKIMQQTFGQPCKSSGSAFETTDKSVGFLCERSTSIVKYMYSRKRCAEEDPVECTQSQMTVKRRPASCVSKR